MSHTLRATFAALFVSLNVAGVLPAVAEEPASTEAPAAEAPVERAPLLPRAQEDSVALERQLPAQDLQQLQAGDERFLALWKPANSDDPKGAVILVPGAGESADWPDVVGPLRRKFPDIGWASLSLTLPNVQDPALQAREADPATATPAAEAGKEAAPAPAPAADTTAAAADPQAQEQARAQAEAEQAAAMQELAKAEAAHVFARLDSAIAFAQQQKARDIVLLGHGSGAYWAARYLNEHASPVVKKLVMVGAQQPTWQPQPSLLELATTQKVKTADFVYQNLASQAAKERLQASKRNKGPGFTQVTLLNMAGYGDAEQEQIFRRVRGWVEAD